jgi:hypothetical protein
MFDVGRFSDSLEFPASHTKNDKSLPSLAAKQGQIGGWEFATLSFPCRH